MLMQMRLLRESWHDSPTAKPYIEALVSLIESGELSLANQYYCCNNHFSFILYLLRIQLWMLDFNNYYM